MYDNPAMDDFEPDSWVEIASFNAGDCTCEHEDEQHTFNGCGEDDCDCEANWEE